MKFFIFLYILSFPAWSKNYKAFCSGNRGQVAISMATYKNRLYVSYSNFLGAKDFPLYEGVVTRMTYPFLKIADEELITLEHEVQVSWPMENCQFSSHTPALMKCSGEAIFHIPKNSMLRSYTFGTSFIREESLTETYDIFKVRWGIEGEYFHHHIAMPFDPKLCSAELTD